MHIVHGGVQLQIPASSQEGQMVSRGTGVWTTPVTVGVVHTWKEEVFSECDSSTRLLHGTIIPGI